MGKNKILNLAGLWTFIKDPNDKFTIQGIEKKIEEDSNLEEMKIPQNWELAGLHNFNGSVWFIKKFNTDESVSRIKILNFLGADYYAKVWLNDNYLGTHEGYFSPFNFNVTKFINNVNTLIVKVSSPFEIPGEIWPDRKRLIKGIFSHHDCRPGGTSKQFGQDQNTGGIWNDVFIEYNYNFLINNVKTSADLSSDYKKANLHFQISCTSYENTSQNISIKFDLTSPQKKKISMKYGFEVRPGINEINYYLEIKNPEFWWSYDLGKPSLYHIKISSKFFADYSYDFGIRNVKLDSSQQFYLNGKRLFLRGTNIIPAQFLSSFTRDKIKRIAGLIKEANINIVRIHAHVNRKELYEEFEKAGILVWQDFSLQWTYDESVSFKTEAVKQIKEMVNHLYNYSSIAFWCCHNEPGNQIKTLDEELERAVLSEDNTRIIRRASNYEEHAYDGWYWGNKEHYAAAPMGPLVTEFGAQALPEKKSLEKFISQDELFPPVWKTWEYHNFQVDQTFNIAKINIGDSIDSFIQNSQSYQTDLIKTSVDFYRRKRFNGITGIFQFMLIDCWESISWSVVDYFGNKKPGYYALKKAYQPVYISVNVRKDQYFPGTKLLIDFYIINDLQENFNSLRLQIYIDNKYIGKIDRFSLKADSMLFISYEDMDFRLPGKIEKGEHIVKTELLNPGTNKIISDNDFKLKVISNLPEEI